MGPAGAHATIQAAIAAAAPGDTVLVAPGTYAEQIDFLGKDIAVLAAAPFAQDSHVIDGGGVGPIVRFHGGEGPAARLEGFTITRRGRRWCTSGCRCPPTGRRCCTS